MTFDRTTHLISLLLAVAGVALTLFLTWAHFSGTLGSICAEGGGCGVVLTSTYSQFFGLPTAFYGFVYYFTVTVVVILFPYLTGSSQHRILTTLMGLNASALTVSLLLTLYSFFELNETCGYCLTSTGLVFGLFACSLVWTIRRTRLEAPERPWSALWKSVSAVLLVLLVVMSGLYFQSSPTVATTEGKSKELTALAGEPNAIGNPNAPIRVVEFFDLACPHCQRFALNVFPKIRKNYIETGKVVWVFRNFPITRSHPNALYAHSILSLIPPENYLSAKKRIMRNSDQWKYRRNNNPESYFNFLLKQYGLPPQQPSQELKESIVNRQRHFAKIGVRATPSFLINGKLYEGGLPYRRIEQIFQSIIRNQDSSFAR